MIDFFLIFFFLLFMICVELQPLDFKKNIYIIY